MQELMFKNKDGTQYFSTNTLNVGTSTSTVTSTNPGTKAETANNQNSTTVVLCSAQSKPVVVPDIVPKYHVEPTVISTNIKEPRMTPLKRQRPTTRSQTYKQHPIDTIVCKWFNDNQYHKGEGISDNAKDEVYKVK